MWSIALQYIKRGTALTFTPEQVLQYSKASIPSCY